MCQALGYVFSVGCLVDLHKALLRLVWLWFIKLFFVDHIINVQRGQGRALVPLRDGDGVPNQLD